MHLGGRGRRISEFKASLVFRMSSSTARAQSYTEKPCLEKPKERASKRGREERRKGGRETETDRQTHTHTHTQILNAAGSSLDPRQRPVTAPWQGRKLSPEEQARCRMPR